MSVPAFAARLESWGAATALIDAEGRAISYRELWPDWPTGLRRSFRPGSRCWRNVHRMPPISASRMAGGSITPRWTGSPRRILALR